MKRTASLITLTIWAICLLSCNTSEQDFKKAKIANTVESYTEFIRKHGNSDLADKARDSVVSLYGKRSLLEIPFRHPDKEISERLHSIIKNRVDSLYHLAEVSNSALAWQTYANTVPQEFIYDAYERKDSLVEVAYQKAKSTNTLTGWEAYLKAVPPEDARDANVIKHILEERAAWATESKAWQTASMQGNQAAYQTYLSKYPKGIHAHQAEKKLIDLEVASIFANKHGTLPQMDKGYSTGTSYSIIEIENRTQYVLTVSYSGPDSKRIVIPSWQSRKVNIGNGFYRVAASVGHGVTPFAGTENLDGSHFSSSFYISTTRIRQ